MQTIGDVMSKSPYSIGPDQPLSLARDLMRKHGIRHLPVLSGGRLVGMVTDRDLFILETFSDVDKNHTGVEEAMTSDVYAVAPDTPLAEVAAQMAERKLGSAVVLEGPKVVGVFTTVDACQVLSTLLTSKG